MMRNILRVSSQIAANPTPQRSDRSNWLQAAGFITPARRAPPLPPEPVSSFTEAQRLNPENKSQCSETSTPDKPSMDKAPSPDNVDTCTSIADRVSDKTQQSPEVVDERRADLACKSQSQLESDAESKQKQINRVFMNLKIAEKVRFSNAYYQGLIDS
jgi:hypothetical protein